MIITSLVIACGSAVLAADITVTISGDGVTTQQSFTGEQLAAMTDQIQQHYYSSINNWPTNKNVYAKGISLSYLLQLSGIKDEATLIKITSTDGYYKTFTVSELLDSERYSYSDGRATEVPVILGLQSSDSSFASMTDDQAPVLVIGQRAATEQTFPWFIKNVSTIEVSADTLARWPQATYEINDAANGYQLELNHSNFDTVKLYYTTDSTTPSVESNMYNISTTYWQPDLIVPLQLTAGTVVKVIAIGPGKPDSEVVTINLPTTSAGTDLSFSDVAKNSWYYDAVDYVSNKGLFQGTSITTFSPMAPMTRAMFVTVLYRLSGEIYSSTTAKFSDVESGSWYADAVTWASEKGIVNGYGNGTFRPLNAVTREQMALIMFNYLKCIGEGPQGAWMINLNYPDKSAISDWAFEAVTYCTMRGLLSGRSNGNFDPQGTANRAEVATVMMRFDK